MKKANLNVYRTVTVKDKDGKIVYKKTEASKSFVIAFLQILEAQSYPSASVSIIDPLNSARSVSESVDNFKCESPATLTTFGIVVGTGTTPPTNTDYTLETKIAHGVGAGQLQYGATSKTTTQVVGANVDLVILRTFVNGSGGAINVTEFGLLAQGTSWYFLTIRDVTAAVAVANGQTLTVSYTFRTTV